MASRKIGGKLPLPTPEKINELQRRYERLYYTVLRPAARQKPQQFH